MRNCGVEAVICPMSKKMERAKVSIAYSLTARLVLGFAWEAATPRLCHAMENPPFHPRASFRFANAGIHEIVRRRGQASIDRRKGKNRAYKASLQFEPDETKPRVDPRA